MCSHYKHKISETCIFLYQAAAKLCLYWVQSTAPIQAKRSKLLPQTHRCRCGKLSRAHRSALGFTKAFMKAEFGPEFRKEECFQHLLPRKNQACQLLFNKRGRACDLTDHSSGFLGACLTTAPCQEWGAREQPLPLCSYPGIRECSRCSRATHPSEIPLCLLQRRQKTQFLLPGAKQKKPKPTAVTSSGCVEVTPEQVLLLLLTPTAHGSLPQHTPCSCKNRFPASITQTVPVTQ